MIFMHCFRILSKKMHEVKTCRVGAPEKQHHLNQVSLHRSNLPRVNESKPYALYRAIFGKLLKMSHSQGFELAINIQVWVNVKSSPQISLTFQIKQWSICTSNTFCFNFN
jgi:hypothetical protein